MSNPDTNNIQENQRNYWEQKLVAELASASIHEQKKARKWGIFFKSLFSIYIAIVLAMFIVPEDLFEESSDGHTALIDVTDVISASSSSSADRVVTALRDAYKDEKTKGIILRLNTPGGSPVQSAYINDEIYRLKKKHPSIKVYAVISDICASGGYYIAAAADKIYANKGSIVGSIGVLISSFGFEGVMDKLGVSRRLYTAGEHKGFLDPYSPEKAQDIVHAKAMLADIHKQFIEVVKKGRGDKLADDAKLFSGYTWSGEEAIAMGLVDHLGSSSYVAREIIGEEKIKDFTIKQGVLDRFSTNIGVSIATKFAELSGLDAAIKLR